MEVKLDAQEQKQVKGKTHRWALEPITAGYNMNFEKLAYVMNPNPNHDFMV